VGILTAIRVSASDDSLSAALVSLLTTDDISGDRRRSPPVPLSRDLVLVLVFEGKRAVRWMGTGGFEPLYLVDL
jgi:hypothetical protein